MSISSDDDTNSTEWDGEYDSELDSDVDLRMDDDVDAPDGVDLDGIVDIERVGADENDEEGEDEKQEEEVDEDEEEDEDDDEDEDNGKEPQTIVQGKISNTWADDADTMEGDQGAVIPEQRQEMCEYTPLPQPPAPARRPQTLQRRLQSITPETNILSGLEFLGLVTLQKPCPVAPTQWEGESARNTSDVDVEQQLLGVSACGDSLSDVPLRMALSQMSLSLLSLSPMCISVRSARMPR